ncbi:hypothetical protein NO108_04952 [Planktothrix rubescens]|nr:hypothetical protein NO108_04952 [Planktothrix rubescens]
MELGNWAISTAVQIVEVLIDGHTLNHGYWNLILNGLGRHRRTKYMIEAVNGGNPKNCHIFIRTVTRIYIDCNNQHLSTIQGGAA